MSDHKSAQSNKADTNDVVLITRWDSGETHYSVDGGEHWWTKEQLNYIAQETNKARIDELMRMNMRIMDDPDDDTNLFWYRTYTMPEFEARLAELQALTADKEQTP